MKGTQRGRDLRVGKSGEHAALLARQHFWRPQQLDQDDFEQPGKYRLLAWPHSRCLGVDHGQDAGQPPAVAGTARRNMHNRWQECREKFFIDGVKFEVPADDANLVRIIVAAPWFRRCGGRREILEGDDRRIASSAAQDPGGGLCQQHAVAWFQALLRGAGQLEATAPADDASEDHAAVSGESPGPVTVPHHVLPQQGTRAQQLDKLGQRIHRDEPPSGRSVIYSVLLSIDHPSGPAYAGCYMTTEGNDMTRTVLITGCSSGFGKAAATKFHDRGWNVVATMRDPGDWDGGSSDRLLTHALDVTDPASIRSAFDAGVARFGSVDAVVNVAGIGLFSVFETTTDETARSVFETNLFGPIEIMRVAIPHLREHGGGRIVNLTSASSIVPEPLMGIYNASKAALDNLTETLRLELSPQNIVLKLIEPGFVPTTRLVEKAQANAPVLTIVPSEYEAYVNQRMAVFSSEFPVELATPEDVADAILASVNDETGQLRWVVGADQAERMHMRHETSEAEYNDWTWSQLGPSR
jgi:NAD(P)-dependent dehydrogenase (short-subunit alcohol dehydrogenase family)